MKATYRCMCGGEGKLIREDRKIMFGRWSITVSDEFYSCEKCGYRWSLPSQMRATQERAAALIREKYGLMAPERIRALRAKYSWTQPQLEQILQVGQKTVVRWERGTVVPGATTNKILKDLERDASYARKLAIERGVAPPATPIALLDQLFQQEATWIVTSFPESSISWNSTYTTAHLVTASHGSKELNEIYESYSIQDEEQKELLSAA